MPQAARCWGIFFVGGISLAGIVISYFTILHCFMLMAMPRDFIFFNVMLLDFVWCIFMRFGESVISYIQ
jgi:hypothetical protein